MSEKNGIGEKIMLPSKEQLHSAQMMCYEMIISRFEAIYCLQRETVRVCSHIQVWAVRNVQVQCFLKI